MSSPITVAFVISAPEWRGSAVSFAKVADGVVARGHRALFVTAHPALTAALRERGYEVEELQMSGTGILGIWRMRSLFLRHRVAVSYADMPRDLRRAALAGRLAGAATAYRFNVNAGRIPSDVLIRLAYRCTGAIVIQSDWTAARIRAGAPAIAARPFHRIPNGYDLSHWRRVDGATVRARLGIAPERPIVLCASIFAPTKRQEFLIDAVERWPASGPRPVLVLAGGKETDAPFLARARASTAELRFAGMPTGTDLMALYSEADVVAQPALNESFGNVLCEAMACEATVIVPDAGAAPEQIGPASEGAGVILPGGDAVAWARTMAELCADPARRVEIGKQARARIAREFPLERMQQMHVDLFEQLAG